MYKRVDNMEEYLICKILNYKYIHINFDINSNINITKNIIVKLLKWITKTHVLFL